MINIKKTSELLKVILLLSVSFLLSYFILESMFCALSFSVFSLILIIKIIKIKKQNYSNNEKVKNICRFINLINSQMLTSKSIYEAYQKIEDELPNDFLNMSELDMIDQLQEISNEYNLNCFMMFVSDLKLFTNNNIDYFEQAKYSSTLCFKEKEIITLLKEKKEEKMKQINYLYIMSVLLLVFIKICISDYYSLMLTNIIYQIILFALLIIGTLSYYFAYKELLNNYDKKI